MYLCDVCLVTIARKAILKEMLNIINVFALDKLNINAFCMNEYSVQTSNTPTYSHPAYMHMYTECLTEIAAR